METKKEKNKPYEDQGKDINRNFVLQDTIESVIGFRIDGRTIKRGALLDNLVILCH
jgi:hypothetical protein